jgi:hypothetical protein
VTTTIISPTSERKRLPNRRLCQTSEIEFAGLHFKISAGYFPTGELAEIFISNHKRGNAVDTAVRDAGILISLCLQHGCSAETIARAVSRNGDGSASGVVAAVLDALGGAR